MIFLVLQTSISQYFVFYFDTMAATIQVLHQLSWSYQGSTSSIVSHYGNRNNNQLAKKRR